MKARVKEEIERLGVNFIIGLIISVIAISISESFYSGWIAGMVWAFICGAVNSKK